MKRASISILSPRLLVATALSLLLLFALYSFASHSRPKDEEGTVRDTKGQHTEASNQDTAHFVVRDAAGAQQHIQQVRNKLPNSLNLTLGVIPQRIEVLSWEPRVFLHHRFLSPEEADHIVEVAGGEVTRSMVVGANGQNVVDNARTSHGTFLTRHREDDVVIDIEERIATWTHIPRENGEIMYLLRYEVGQEYKPHLDFFDPKSAAQHIGRAGNRIATVLMYLSDVEEGGETIFPQARGGQVSARPRKGDATLFWDSTPDGDPDYMSLHGGNPVIKGTKWSLTRWIRANRFM